MAELGKLYPDVRCSLDYSNPFELLVAVILSAQCTDKRVNLTTPALFKKFPTPKAMAGASLEELEKLIRPTGFYKNKSKNIKAMVSKLISEHEGKVPATMEQLTALPGVGRKTANVILGEIYKIPAMVVDTHVTRLSNRLDLARGEDAVLLEFTLEKIINKNYWTVFSHWLISHGRAVCKARQPQCHQCTLSGWCSKRGV